MNASLKLEGDKANKPNAQHFDVFSLLKNIFIVTPSYLCYNRSSAKHVFLYEVETFIQRILTRTVGYET